MGLQWEKVIPVSDIFRNLFRTATFFSARYSDFSLKSVQKAR